MVRKLFPYLDDNDINLLKEIITDESFPKKKVIIESETICFDFFYIEEGIVRGYFISEKGEEINVFIGNDGLFIGAPESILNGSPTKYYFETVVSTKLFKFDFRQLEKLAIKNENIFRFYTDSLKAIMNIFVRRLEGFTSDSAQQRFLDLYKNRPLLISNAHKKEIATFLGISPNSLSRIISKISNGKSNPK